jgi:hypothetical protein
MLSRSAAAPLTACEMGQVGAAPALRPTGYRFARNAALNGVSAPNRAKRERPGSVRGVLLCMESSGVWAGYWAGDVGGELGGRP